MSFQEEAAAAIRDSGGRMTGQRQAIINMLAAQIQPVDAERLFQLASREDTGISLVTVYRTLHTLEAARLISPHYISREHDRKYYRIVARAERFHFTCRRCHRVIPFQSALLQQIKANLSEELKAEISTICMCVDGLCADCHKGLEA